MARRAADVGGTERGRVLDSCGSLRASSLASLAPAVLASPYFVENAGAFEVFQSVQ
jgi:hypothetical protein